jgi:type 1 glutamine amidotransferase
MKILVLCDDHWHPASVVRSGLQDLVAHDFHFVWIEDAKAWSPQLMDSFPVILLSKSNNVSSGDQAAWMTPEAAQAFVDYVRQGGGLLAVHSGLAGYQDVPGIRTLLGGVFAHHPEQCPVTITPRPGHWLAEGAEPFTLKDEHYHMTMNDGEVDVFMTTESLHGSQPGGWRRAEGLGRVVVLTPGHNLEVWQHPAYQKILSNALRWVGQEK